ncbi:hypothetical protein D9756_005709 [Leucocoprinus leucothites]|uniref:F-box domain-containing protein n=1 Tax=Leucocoprinus leucothites TaxID=201217 RepID=A0A8H5FZV8_9AGAR|nr:hypothetical protein D9756_005709 [Leucoagaricus leucothites]
MIFSSHSHALNNTCRQNHLDCSSAERQYKDLHQRNTTQSSIHHLPPELLSLILQYACPPVDLSQRYGIHRKPGSKLDKHFQFTLGAVSAHWRQITFSTPQLWTSVDIVVRPNNLERSYDTLQLFLASSGELPVSIGLKFFEDQQIKKTVNFPTILEHSHRIRELHLTNPPPSWVRSLTSSYTTMFCLSIENPPGDDDLFFDVPCSHLSIEFTTSRILPRWATITHLCLTELQEDVCLELLKECINLVEFRNRAPTNFDLGPRIPVPTSPFILPDLKIFEWPVYSQSYVDTAMLKNVHMPALETLVWMEEDRRSLDESDSRITFFDHLPSTLSVLHLDNRRSHFTFTSSISYLIRRVLNVEHLFLQFVHGSGLASLICDLAIDDEAIDERPALPRLKTIVLRVKAEVLSYFRDVFDALLGMIESRLHRRSRPLPQQQLKRLEIVVYSGQVEWPAEFKEEMKEFVKQGLELEIMEETMSVDWL